MLVGFTTVLAIFSTHPGEHTPERENGATLLEKSKAKTYRSVVISVRIEKKTNNVFFTVFFRVDLVPPPPLPLLSLLYLEVAIPEIK